MTHRLCVLFLSIIMMLSIALTGCGSSDSGSTSYWGGDSSGGTTTTAPQVTSSVNLNNPGQPIRPGDWIQISGQGFGSTQGANYVQFTNGSGTNANADLYSSWTDTQIVCRLPADALKSGSDNKAAQWGSWGKYRPYVARSKSGKLTKDMKNTLRGKYHLFGKKLESTPPAERTHRGKFNPAASTFWARDTWTFKVFVNNQSSTPTNINANPTPNPTPSPAPPSPSPSPSPTSTPSPSPTPTTSPSPSPSPSPTSGGGGGGGGGPTPTPSKITIAGEFQSVRSRNGIASANTDGSLNTAFDPGAGIAVEEDSEDDAAIYTTVVQADGRILIGGWFSSYNGNACSNIARLNADGSFDATFNPGGDTGADGEIYSIAVQSDGKILIGGDFTSYTDTTGTTTCNYIARLNAGGTLDTTFNVTSEDPLTYGAGANGPVYSIAVQTDGQILIGGCFTSYNETARSSIARLNSGKGEEDPPKPDGSLDTDFDPGDGVFYSYDGDNRPGVVYSIAVQADGQILIGGEFTQYNGEGNPRSGIARLTDTGALDESFDPGDGVFYSYDGVNYPGVVLSIALLPTVNRGDDYQILIGGWFTQYNGEGNPRSGIARLDTTGGLDTTFNPGTGVVFTYEGGTYPGEVYSIAVQSDGQILIGGDFTLYNETGCNCIARLDTTGGLDTTFNYGTGTNECVETIALQSNGKVILGGYFTSYNSPSYGVAQLNTDGTPYTTFNPGANLDGPVHSFAVQSDGKVIIGGEFTHYGETECNYIARLNTDGTLDTAFNNNIGDGPSDYVNSIALQSDGKILIGGNFTSYNGTDCGRITRLTNTGALDGTFNNEGTGANGSVYAIAVQSDGKILIGGFFVFYNDTVVGGFARLTNTGTLDEDFNNGEHFDGPSYSIAVQADGKILVGGWFTEYDDGEYTCNYIARLTNTGTFDTSFDTGTGASGPVYTIAVQPDGQILIGGDFSSYDDVIVWGFARLNSGNSAHPNGGTLDGDFNNGEHFDGPSSSITVQSDGKILVGGEFEYFDEILHRHIVRLKSDGTIDTSFSSNTQPDGNVGWHLDD